MRTQKGILRAARPETRVLLRRRMNRVAKAIKETEAAAKFIATRYSRAYPRGGGCMVQDGLALGLIPGVGWRAAEIRRVAREAEEAGFAGCLPPRSTTMCWQRSS
jgi:hypothetical protein